MSDLHTITTPRLLSEGRYAWTVPPGWRQGRGAFGGLVLAGLTRAIEAHEADAARVLRSLNAELPGPTRAGEVEILVETLREGSSVSTVSARLVQGGNVQAHAVAVLGEDRGEPDDPDAGPATWDESQLEALPDWQAIEPVPHDQPFVPEFAHNMEFRLTGPLPFAAGPARTGMFVRPRVPTPSMDSAFIVAMADVPWPAAFSRFDAPRPMATVSYSLQLVGGLAGLPDDAPVHCAGHAITLRQGYSVEHRVVRGADGRLLALNQQTFAVLG